MDFGLILGLIKVGLEIFKDERKGRYLKKYVKLEKDWYEEMDKSDSERSDFALDSIMRESRLLAKLVVAEANK